ncbi:diablo, IAP-binding mitochondrial protein a isoform X2 [Megalops cyprinoides]|uniref:diablo, IAP-binding mitochondrial protein a isoform X2 n=1 Tax=Megalops cyprinoides TaxID=118141 RepID=UPI0018647D15|nr:diablo, IAP-binding mitochondrial protein a isoform X2 [Megalops cyprinoides]
MQATRHCLVCSTRGLLDSRTNFLQLAANMAAFRRTLACVSLLRNTAGVPTSSRFTRQRLGKLPTVVRSNWISLSVGGGLCTIPFSQQVENLSHDALIRRASSLVTDSANTYLSQTTLALVDSLTQYSKALHTLIALQKRYLNSIGKLTPAEEDSIWQVIIGQRVEVGDKLEECKRFESNWLNAINLCELAAEAAYNAGVEPASITTRNNLQVAQSQVEQMRQLSLDAERKLAETKAEEIQRMAEYASTMDKMAEEVPEAYLRED